MRGSTASAPQNSALFNVAPVEGQEWQHPPFGAEIHDGNLYGRGAVDMKNFAGTILAIARAYRRVGVVPRRDLIFAFFADEEAGGVWGAQWLVKHRPELFAGATEALSEVGGFLARLGIAGYGFVPLRVPHDFDVFGQFHTADKHIPVESLRFSAPLRSAVEAHRR